MLLCIFNQCYANLMCRYYITLSHRRYTHQSFNDSLVVYCFLAYEHAIIFLVLCMFFHCFMYKLYINLYINSALWLPEHGYCITVDPSPVFFLHSLLVCLGLDSTRRWCIWAALVKRWWGEHTHTHTLPRPSHRPSSRCVTSEELEPKVTWCHFGSVRSFCWSETVGGLSCVEHFQKYFPR